MGCDIHAYREKKVNGKWITADKWTPYDCGDGEVGNEVKYDDRCFTGRNYHLFGLLSKGVRADFDFSFQPRGIPSTASSQYIDEVNSWGIDGHGHSYIYLHELKDMVEFLETKTTEISGMKDREGLDLLKKSINSGNPDWSLLFPYCGYGSKI